MHCDYKCMLAYIRELCLCLLSYDSRGIGRKLTGLIMNNNLEVEGMEVPWLRSIHIAAERPWIWPVLPTTRGGDVDC